MNDVELNPGTECTHVCTLLLWETVYGRTLKNGCNVLRGLWLKGPRTESRPDQSK